MVLLVDYTSMGVAAPLQKRICGQEIISYHWGALRFPGTEMKAATEQDHRLAARQRVQGQK
tara:strand:+ start:620 stop:802 length:183 start_codon:yes stop_codon:yes gene_type:complete